MDNAIKHGGGHGVVVGECLVPVDVYAIGGDDRRAPSVSLFEKLRAWELIGASWHEDPAVVELL